MTAEGETLRFIQSKDDCFIVGWRHSVEKTPWKETYRVRDGDVLELESTDYQSYGAGTPDAEGQVELLPDGYIRVTEIERTIPYYSLFYIPISRYYIKIDGKRYGLEEFVPAYEKVQIHYRSLRAYERIFSKI